MSMALVRMGAAARRGIIPPTITAPAVLTWDVTIGSSPTVTPPTYTGSPSTITYTLRRDGVGVAGLEDVDLATIEAHVGEGVSGTDARDIGPDIDLAFEVTNSAGSDSGTSNVVVFDDATHLANVAMYMLTEGVTTADGGTTVDAIAQSYGGWNPGAFSATGSGVRPAYEATGGVGGRPRMVTDGAVDYLLRTAMTKGSAWVGHDFGAVCSISADGANGDYLLAIGSAVGERRRLNELGSNMRSQADDETGTPVGPTSTTTYTPLQLRSGDWSASGATLNWRQNRVVETSVANANDQWADAANASVGASVAGGQPAAWNVHGFYFCYDLLTSAQRLHLGSLFTYHTGVAC